MVMTGSNVVELRRSPLTERFAQSADGVLEQIADDYGVNTFEVMRAAC
jgi:putative heme iron utilization protein